MIICLSGIIKDHIVHKVSNLDKNIYIIATIERTLSLYIYFLFCLHQIIHYKIDVQNYKKGHNVIICIS